MNIKILNLQLLNFKGVRSLNIDFGNITNITGDNATGKTTVFDAFTWLLFGKNSNDDKDFNIKTLDKNNQPINKLSHEVQGTIVADGREIKLRRCYREKWVKKRGSSTEEFTGHETEYYVDDVPLSQKEFQGRVDLIINDAIAKMITNPLFFNSLKWQERRGVLEAMAGTITNEEIISGNKEFADLVAQIGNESLVNFKKKINAQKSKIKETLETIPSRIDEVKRSYPEEQDYNALRAEIKTLEKEIAGIDEAIEDKSKVFELQFKAIQQKQTELNNLKLELSKFEAANASAKQNKLNALNNELNELKLKADSETRQINSLNAEIANKKSQINNLDNQNAKLREDWSSENSKKLVIDEHALNCPTCGQTLPEEAKENKVETLTKKFNEAKQNALAAIDQQGKSNKALMEKLSGDVIALEKQFNELTDVASENDISIDVLRLKIDQVSKQEVEPTEEIINLKKQIDAFVIPTTPTIDNNELKQKKSILQLDLNAANRKLATEEQIPKIDARIAELESQEKTMANELAQLERTEFTIAQFSKAKIETIENRINGKFKMVKFKMFEQQINGGETEACECLVNGVPYSDVNTAGKIQAGIDIINALTDHYNTYAPIWIDNRESVIKLPECKSQIINLIATANAPLTAAIEK